MQIKNKFFKFSVNRLEMNFYSKQFNFHLHKWWLNTNGIWGFSGFRRWEIDVRPTDWQNLHFEICKFKRLWGDFVFCIEIGIPFLNFSFVITDSRIWDCYEDKPVTWEVYEKLPDRPLKELKYRYRTQGKEKWYFTSQFLKIYNFDFLNDPYGFTLDLALFPTLLYTLFQVGIHQRHSFEFGFSINRENINICLTLFSLYLNFEIGKNTVIRQANLKYIDDFVCVVNHFGNPYYTDRDNILQKQIQRKNLPFVWQILNLTDVEKFNTDEILSHAAFDDEYNKDIFKLLCEKIGHFDNWEEINKYKNLYDTDAIEELKKLPTKKVSAEPLKLPKNLEDRLYYFEKRYEWENTLSVHFGKMSGIDLRLAHTSPFRWFMDLKHNFEIESSLDLTRKYYFYLHIFNNAGSDKFFELTKDSFSPFILRIFLPLKFCRGLYFELQLTEYHFNVPELDFNYKKNRPYTTEELILINELGKKI